MLCAAAPAISVVTALMVHIVSAAFSIYDDISVPRCCFAILTVIVRIVNSLAALTWTGFGETVRVLLLRAIARLAVVFG